MSMSISVSNVSKLYPNTSTNYRTLRDDLYHLTGRLFWFLNSHSERKADHFWALRHINFEVKRGERVGIIGHNKSGKTTLLRILAGIIAPTEGKVKLNGRTGVLIGTSAGFQPELTGKENLYLNGIILGMSRREIQQRYDEIVEFSGLGDSMDMPLKRYSSGMQARLGFSVATHCRPDILLIDEVLSVGDLGFRRKSLEHMRRLATEGNRTVIFVSQSMGPIKQLCTRCIMLNQGHIVADGHPEEVTARYLRSMNVEGQEGENLYEHPHGDVG